MERVAVSITHEREYALAVAYGVRTAGGVISTGGPMVMGMGFIRMPFRGWYLANDGQDMELNGAIPDAIVWPLAPGMGASPGANTSRTTTSSASPRACPNSSTNIAVR